MLVFGQVPFTCSEGLFRRMGKRRSSRIPRAGMEVRDDATVAAKVTRGREEPRPILFILIKDTASSGGENMTFSFPGARTRRGVSLRVGLSRVFQPCILQRTTFSTNATGRNGWKFLSTLQHERAGTTSRKLVEFWYISAVYYSIRCSVDRPQEPLVSRSSLSLALQPPPGPQQGQ